jgi:hypothetical protein
VSGAELPPHIAAGVDQDLAELRSLATLARQHVDAYGCDFPGVCSGPWVPALIVAKGHAERDRLLNLAVAELAALDYGAPVHLTEAALTALAEKPKPKRRGWWSWPRR